jgi:hypothetical protein
MRRWSRRAALTLFLIASVVVPWGAGVAAPQAAERRASINFLSTCSFSHALPDDPIVRPGRRGASHLHLFFGSRGTNAFSTSRSLRASRTTCNRRADTAAYWVPALLADGRVVTPDRAVVYYQTRSRGSIRSFPPGLRIVAGSAHATRPQPITRVFWNCELPPGPLRPAARPPICVRRWRGQTRAGQLALNVVFPDCWDGRRLDSPDHQSHMAFADDLVCPAGHPVKVPRIRLSVYFRTDGRQTYTLSSGGLHSGHADFFNAWEPQELARIVRDCSAGIPRCAKPS